MKPKLYLINGPLGAGKTTFLRQLLGQSSFENARVIENEFASTSVDTDQLHDHQAEVQTIAGVCICCSTGDELAEALLKLSDSQDPVVIEATGVANSLKLIEKIVVADMLEKYDVAHALFILDAVEAVHALDSTIDTYRHELQGADLVLVSKTDLISDSDAHILFNKLNSLQVTQVAKVSEGLIDFSLIKNESHILDYFSNLNDVVNNHDINTNYTIINVDNETLNKELVQARWNEVVTLYGLKRMKGNFSDITGARYHIEATSAQCRVTPYESGENKLVFIGAKARELNLKNIMELFGNE